MGGALANLNNNEFGVAGVRTAVKPGNPALDAAPAAVAEIRAPVGNATHRVDRLHRDETASIQTRSSRIPVTPTVFHDQQGRETFSQLELACIRHAVAIAVQR